jgi:D-alanyl-lipoteichoic acid acyltransferase DltB (MBOAT superfamily)
VLFTSYKYWLALAVFFVAYWAATRLSRGHRAQNIVLLLGSYAFYAFWDWRWCALLAGISATGFFGALWLERTASRKRRRQMLILLVVLNLAALGIFKYFGFFADSLATLLGHFGLSISQGVLALVLPVGLSYYTFQNLSYVIDVYRHNMAASRDALGFFVALSFFPQLLAGPITRPRSLLPQLSERRVFDDQLARDGLRQFLWGLFKKVLIADGIGVQVDYIWANYHSLDGLSLLLGALLYSLQIYCDFSGYADMAIGSGKLFGIKLAKNFEYPYFAASMREFWRRWHITLSTWARDYVYIPLGGNRVGRIRQAFNIIVTFLVIGFWHGPNWTFLVWGGLHGLYQLPRVVSRDAGTRSGRLLEGKWWAVASGLCVFLLVTFAWVFFRAPSMSEAIGYLAHGVSTPYEAVDHVRYLPWVGLSCALLLWEAFMRRREHGLDLSMLSLPARWAAYLVVCLALLLVGQFGGPAGIYVQF